MATSPNQSQPTPTMLMLPAEGPSLEQRRINLIWEYTQAIIALVVVLSTMVTGVYVIFVGRENVQIPNVIATAFGIVVGFYFSRNNHGANGSSKPPQKH